MKQHITPKQLQEIDRFDLAEKFPNSSWGYYERSNYYQYHCKKLTIGKMIEIIEICGIEYTVDDGYWPVWEVKTINCEDIKVFQCDELADALWEAVKYVLSES